MPDGSLGRTARSSVYDSLRLVTVQSAHDFFPAILLVVDEQTPRAMRECLGNRSCYTGYHKTCRAVPVAALEINGFERPPQSLPHQLVTHEVFPLRSGLL